MTRAAATAPALSQLPRSATRLALPLLCLAASACAWNANASPGSTWIDSDPAVVDVEWGGNLCVVDVHLGERGPYRFLLDTGAATTFVTPECARDAGLRLGTADVQIDAAGASATRDVGTATVGELRIGPARFSSVPAAVVEMEPGFDGVLGFPVFADLLLTLDGPRQRLVLERGRLPLPNGVDVLSLEPGDLAYECPRVRGRVGKETAVFLIDSGFDALLWMERGFPETYGLAFEPDPDGAATVSTEAGRREVTLGRLHERIELGPLTLEDPPVIAGRGTPWILGGAFLRDVVTTFDQRSQRVRFAGDSH